ncbi:unnamed protein product [Gordionus sp. m RMFG-2023]
MEAKTSENRVVMKDRTLPSEEELINNEEDGRKLAMTQVQEGVRRLVQSYQEIFNEDLGCLRDYEVDIKLKDGYVPKFCALRRILRSIYPLLEWRMDLELELDHWVQRGIVCPVEYSV